MRTAPEPDPLTPRWCLLGGAAALVALSCLHIPAWAQPAGIPPVPPRRIELTPPRPPTDRLAWQPGQWDWNAAEERYVWRPGRQIIRRPGTTRYESGRWVQTGGDWVWRRARWR
jgi:hypothetical protein